MKYCVYINESGSLNKFNEGFFSISSVLIKENEIINIKNWVNRNFAKMRIRSGFNKNIDLRSHRLKSAKNIAYLFKFNNDLQRKNKIICTYISNENINKKWLEDKDATFNFMIKISIMEAIKLKYLNQKDSLKIILKNKPETFKYVWNTEKYLNETIVKKEKLESLTLEYQNYRKNWGIEMADWVSLVNYKKLSTQLANGAYFRKIF